MQKTKVVTLIFILLSLTFVPLTSTQDAVIIFIGFPKVGMRTNGLVDGVLQELSKEKVIEDKLGCMISKLGNKYYWTSRDNWEVEKIVRGAFITFKRLDRPDYVRIVDPSAKEVAALLDKAVDKFDYIEHLTINLGFVTYWGQTVSLDPMVFRSR